MLESPGTVLFTVKGGSSQGPAHHPFVPASWMANGVGNPAHEGTVVFIFLLLPEKKLGEKWFTLHACMNFSPWHSQAEGNCAPWTPNTLELG